MALDIYRYRNAASGSFGSVPTDQMKTGDFTQLLGPSLGTDPLGRPIFQGEIYDPATTRTLPDGTNIRDPFACNGQLNVICSSRFSSISQFFQKGYSSPNQPGVANNWIGSAGQTQIDKDQISIKLDHNINSKNRFSFATDHLIPWGKGATSGHSYIAGASGFLQPDINTGFIDDRSSYRYRFNYVWNMTANAIFDFRAGVTRNPHRFIGKYPEGGTTGADSGLQGTLSSITPNVSFSGQFSGFGPIFHGYLVASQRTPINADVVWQKGSHNIKLGADFQGLPYSFSGFGSDNGGFSFSPLETGLPGFSTTGSSWASFLLGEVDNAGVSTPFSERVFSGGYGFYAQDKWRVTSKLTLNYGLRWNLFIPMHEQHNKMSSFDPNLPNPGAGGRLGALSIYGTGPGRNGLTRVSPYYYRAFEPKVGFAYQITPKTVARASYGISYFPFWQKWYSTVGSTQPQDGFTVSRSKTSEDSGITPAFNWDNGFPLTFPPLPNIDPSLDNGSGIGYIDRNEYRPPMIQNVSVELARELPGQLYLRLGYVGTFSHRLPANGINLDPVPFSALGLGNLLLAQIDSPEAKLAGIPVPYPGFTGSVAQALRPYPQYLGVSDLYAQFGNANYNSLQVNLQKRFGGLTFLVAYTISKNLTNDQFGGYGSVGTPLLQYPSSSFAVKSLSQLDRPQLLNISWKYDLPFGKGKRYLGSAGEH